MSFPVLSTHPRCEAHSRARRPRCCRPHAVISAPKPVADVQRRAEPGSRIPRPRFNSSKEVVAYILGGGPGADLWPLTATRAEPAVPFGAQYRLIDIPVSNCVNSGVYQIYVLAQYNSTSLNRHVARAYSFLGGIAYGREHGFVEPLNATQTPGTNHRDAWYQGTADAVRKFAHYLDDPKHEDAEDVLVMCGDQLYRMDFAELINYHRASGADVTVASTPADEDNAMGLGVLQVDDDLNVLAFCEKPGRELLATMSMDTAGSYGLNRNDANLRPFVASMGIYCFKKEVLKRMLFQDFPTGNDFSRDMLPYLVNTCAIKAFPHKTYWQDVGSLKRYYSANLDLAQDTSKLKLWQMEAPVHTASRTLPPSKLYHSEVERSLLGDGCRILHSRIDGCVIGASSYIDHYCDLKDTIVFGADSFDTAKQRAAEAAAGGVPLGIGARSTVHSAIVDRNARIGADCCLTNREGVVEAHREAEGVCIRDGILVIMRGATIPPGTVI